MRLPHALAPFIDAKGLDLELEIARKRDEALIFAEEAEAQAREAGREIREFESKVNSGDESRQEGDENAVPNGALCLCKPKELYRYVGDMSMRRKRNAIALSLYSDLQCCARQLSGPRLLLS